MPKVLFDAVYFVTYPDEVVPMLKGALGGTTVYDWISSRQLGSAEIKSGLEVQLASNDKKIDLPLRVVVFWPQGTQIPGKSLERGLLMLDGKMPKGMQLEQLMEKLKAEYNALGLKESKDSSGNLKEGEYYLEISNSVSCHMN